MTLLIAKHLRGRRWTGPMSAAIVFAILGHFTGACLAQQGRLLDARASMPYIGTATMLDDGTVELHLRLGSDGKPVSDTLTYKTTDRAYDGIVRHLRGLRPGETKSFTPWAD
jgi:hypothetical protein